MKIVGMARYPFKYAVGIGRDYPLHSSSCDTTCMKSLAASVAWNIEEIWSRSGIHANKACVILRFEN